MTEKDLELEKILEDIIWEAIHTNGNIAQAILTWHKSEEVRELQELASNGEWLESCGVGVKAVTLDKIKNRINELKEKG